MNVVLVSFLGTLFVAAISGATVLAYKDPEVYQRLVRLVDKVLFGAFLVVAGVHLGMVIGGTHVQLSFLHSLAERVQQTASGMAPGERAIGVLEGLSAAIEMVQPSGGMVLVKMQVWTWIAMGAIGAVVLYMNFLQFLFRTWRPSDDAKRSAAHTGTKP